ncbi:MAG: DNA-processing protein DprA [Planctomycetia bacterium]|nr:DNA-processing protein DprA [Planctomycetia bacterium]
MSLAESSAPDSPSQDGLVDWLTLTMVPGVGPRTLKQLLEVFGTPAAVLDAPTSRLRDVQGVGPKLSRLIAAARTSIDAAAELALCRQHGLRILIPADPDYPRMLHEIHDPPGVLFMRGDLKPADMLSVAIVGSRHATHYGTTQAERLAGSLARAGLTIVSGLARGIDAAAHRGAIEAGGRTLAVLGGGILNIYPPEHGGLADQVAAQGALLSESPPRAVPMAGSFPQRNRIVTGMSLGVIVVEATERSGALISARHAMEQGREVFAVPGRIDSRTSRGCHALIRDGAKLIESAADVLEELGPLVAQAEREDGTTVRHPAELQLNETETKVLQGIGADATSIDQLVGQCGLPISRVLSTLSVLEMRRLIRRISGQYVARV